MIVALLMYCITFNFLIPEIFLLFIDQLKKREKEEAGEKNRRNIKSFNEPGNAFCTEFVKREEGGGGNFARGILLRQEKTGKTNP